MRAFWLAACAAVCFVAPSWAQSPAAPAPDPSSFDKDIATEAGDVGQPEDGVSYPHLTGEINLQIQSDKTFGAPSGTPPIRNTYSDSQANFGLYFNKNLSLQATLHLFQVKEQEQTSWFGGQGLFLEQLFLNYETDALAAYGGKFDPTFGIAWQKAPGVYGNNFSYNDYRLIEGDGVGGVVKFDSLSWGSHNFGLSAWFKDSTPLSYTIFNRPTFGLPTTIRPGRLYLSDGTPANTQSLNSFSASLRGDSLPVLPNFAYNIDYTSMAPGATETARQNLLAIGAQYKVNVTKEIAVKPLVEYVRMQNANGNPDGLGENRNYWTVGAEAIWKQWSLSGVWSERAYQEPTDGGQLPQNYTDQLFTASIGYTFDFGLQAQLGIARQKLLDQWSNTGGVLLSYNYRF